MSSFKMFMKQLSICGLMVTAMTAALSAGEPYLVADMNQTPLGSEPEFFVRLDEKVFFSAFHPDSGRELWSSDGTTEGTRIVKDIVPGEGSSEPSEPIVYDGRLFFSATTEEYGRELWASDGTEDGTVLVRDTELGSLGGNPRDLVAFDGLLFFTAGGFTYGRELWMSDGTEDGTRIAVDIVPGGVGSEAGGLTVSGDHLFFYAENFEFGREPWVSDGTVAGTLRLADIWPGQSGGLDGFPTFIGEDGSVYFRTIYRADADQELWVSDGTPEGTRQVDLTAIDDPRQPQPLAFVGGRLLFTTFGNKLWALAAEELIPLGDFHTVRSPLTAGDEIFFSDGIELWRSDGTPDGTSPFLESVSGGPGNFHPIAFESGRLWYTRQEQPSWGLWTSEGPAESTVLVRESPLGYPDHPTFLDGKVWFVDSDGDHGPEPWLSDGTPEGTRLVRDVDDLRTESFSFQRLMSISRDRLLIFGIGDLWITDGTGPGTTRVPGSELLEAERFRPRVARVGERVYFPAESPDTGDGIWWTDGDQVGLLTDLAPGGDDLYLLALSASNDRLLFVLGDEERVELWSSDGETIERLTVIESTELFEGNPPLAPSAEIRGLGETTIVFAGWDQQYPLGHREVLLQTDGSIEGTRRVTQLEREYAKPSAALGGSVYFMKRGELFSLWKTDGTIAGTVRVATFPAGVADIESVRAVGDHVAVVAYLNISDNSFLWLSDGTVGSLVEVPIFGGFISEVVATPGRLWVVTDGFSPGPLYKIDAETLEVERVQGFEGVNSLVAYAGVLYFRVSGSGAWRTDGTPDGTVFLGPVGPGASAKALGNTLLFPDYHPTYGTELWAMNHDCLASSETLCLAEGRFQAQSLWRDRSGAATPGRTLGQGAGSGTFSFSDEETPELTVKVLDGRSVNDHFWAFSGAATDLEVELHLLDVTTGAQSRHLHPAGDLSSVADIQAFADTVTSSSRQITAISGPGRVAITDLTVAPSSCQATATTLCLLGGRFEVSLERRHPTGLGFSNPISDHAGALSYFRNGSPELIVKVLDGRAINGQFWVYTGSLTDLAFDLRVTDTATGAQRVYSNPAGRLGGFADIEAFGASPPP